MRRYRCHKATEGGKVTAPALVTVNPDGTATVEPYTHEVYATVDFNGDIAIDTRGMPHFIPRKS